MREDICSIPVNDVFMPKDGCPFCRMRDMLEDRMATYITGAAMMEPDVRVETNRLAFAPSTSTRSWPGAAGFRWR